jgi:hypothetical protein
MSMAGPAIDCLRRGQLNLDRKGAITMSKTNNPVESCQPRRPADELTELDLCNVTGGSKSSGAGAGKASFHDFSITKHVDKASPVLFL